MSGSAVERAAIKRIKIADLIIRNRLFLAYTEKGYPMAVKIIIKRQVTESMTAQLTPLLIKLRNLAMNQPGYITGETLKRIDRPDQSLVISTWKSVEAWRQWVANTERVADCQNDIANFEMLGACKADGG